jgi:hypothetical protein
MFIRIIAMIIALYAFGMGSQAGINPPADTPNLRRFPREQPPLIPMPQAITWGKTAIPLDKVCFRFPATTDFPEQLELVKRQLNDLATATQLTADPAGYPISLAIVPDPAANAEAYALAATPTGTTLSATSVKGLFYAVQTLEQLICRRDNATTLAACEIRDFPKFPIRGFMNDVGRNYLSPAVIREILDAMASYKLNVYHFHCTEIHGWRLESKRYPQLQDPASFTRKPGKFYSQQEFVELVQYARLRNITVIPELDMPGHSEAFRKALKIDKMEDPKVTQILCDLIDELCSLVPKEQMPYLHIGTDESRGAAEKISPATLKAYLDAVTRNGRRPICWSPGLSVKGTNPIRQTWTGRMRPPPAGCDFIDSQENYLNHFDPFEAISTLYFRKNCDFPKSHGLGGILCSWPDMIMENERAHLSQTPVLPSLVTYAEALWRDPHAKDRIQFFTNLPPQGSPDLAEFKTFEDRLLAHRDRFFQNLEFPYLRHSDIPWKIIGPIPHGGKTDTQFPVEDAIRPEYTIDGKTYAWSPERFTGATVIFKHYCDYPTPWNPVFGKQTVKDSTFYALTYIHSPKDQAVPFWIGFHTWATSDLRNGTASIPGKWFHADPQIWINGQAIPPPQWQNPPRRDDRNSKIPLVDENYHFRAPTLVNLKAGWNPILIKSPGNAETRRWMFTCIPLQWDPQHPGCNLREFPDLRFATEPAL